MKRELERRKAVRMKFDFRVGNLILQVNSSQTQVVLTAQVSEGPAPKMHVSFSLRGRQTENLFKDFL